jgi:LacI family transcriptional regulator
MTTILDVAKRAGVSPMTVSRVVNESGSVSPELRARVEEALAETGYVPNTVARNLRAKRTDTIALLMPDMTNPFFTWLAQGVETAARQAGISLLLANTDQREDEEERLAAMLLQRQIDGLLIIPAGSGVASVRLCRDRGVPVVVVDRRPQTSDIDVVRADAEGGSLELGQLLVSLGHRRSAVLTGPASVPTAMDRAASFSEAFETAGHPAPRIEHGPFTVDGAISCGIERSGCKSRLVRMF